MIRCIGMKNSKNCNVSKMPSNYRIFVDHLMIMYGEVDTFMKIVTKLHYTFDMKTRENAKYFQHNEHETLTKL